MKWARHRKFWTYEKISQDLREPDSHGKHLAGPKNHTHVFVLIARFEGMRSAIGQCMAVMPDGSQCGATETQWVAL